MTASSRQRRLRLQLDAFLPYAQALGSDDGAAAAAPYAPDGG